MEFVEVKNDVQTGERTLSDLGIRRLTEFDFAGGQQAFFRFFNRYFEEQYGELPQPPFPVRSPPIVQRKAAAGFATETKPFGKNVVFN